ncbi:hypothetical protein [Ammoniphilus sp. YIM 78166]|uniref:hypothetical protein n=1 Tax=Ammoniphilus sp. YIM 78166 TaxID=1644106 RepID=UPI00106F0B23|nr:hypothetical protein [Ammoniphilus sp. YIM 78166]
MELKEHCPDIMFQTFYVDVDIAQTNHYRIKKNPTTLLVGEDDQELFRLEGFKETEEILNIIDGIGNQVRNPIVPLEENKETNEKYMIYLLDKDSLAPVQTNYKNMTSVKTPRITLINLLLKANVEGLENPFPSNTILELVQFEGSKGHIEFRFPRKIKEAEIIKMKLALEKSLLAYGITEVEIIESY